MGPAVIDRSNWPICQSAQLESRTPASSTIRGPNRTISIGTARKATSEPRPRVMLATPLCRAE